MAKDPGADDVRAPSPVLRGIGCEPQPEPAWLRRGLPDGVVELFEACPAWMPDVTGADRMPHAYADALRDMRRSLLDELGGADAGRRPSVPITVTKRTKRPAAATTT